MCLPATVCGGGVGGGVGFGGLVCVLALCVLTCVGVELGWGLGAGVCVLALCVLTCVFVYGWKYYVELLY